MSMADDTLARAATEIVVERCDHDGSTRLCAYCAETARLVANAVAQAVTESQMWEGRASEWKRRYEQQAEEIERLRQAVRDNQAEITRVATQRVQMNEEIEQLDLKLVHESVSVEAFEAAAVAAEREPRRLALEEAAVIAMRVGTKSAAAEYTARKIATAIRASAKEDGA